VRPLQLNRAGDIGATAKVPYLAELPQSTQSGQNVSNRKERYYREEPDKSPVRYSLADGKRQGMFDEIV